MTNAARWIALSPALAVAAAASFMLLAGDPTDGPRDRLAAMTAGERKAIERNRAAYDKLTAFEQHELKRLAEDLGKLPPKEREELEATMGRLQAWVATFPDEIRARYDQEMTSGKIAILKERLKLWEQEKAQIAAQVRRANEIAKRAEAGGPPRFANQKQLERLAQAAERWARTDDDKALLKLVRESQRLAPMDKGIALSCIGPQANAKGPIKRVMQRNESPLNRVPVEFLRRFTFVPAFARLADGAEGGLSDANRAELAKVLQQIYLLTPPTKPVDGNEVRKRLNLEPGDALVPAPVYLLHQLALLKGYADGRTVPLGDKTRVQKILER